MQNNDYPRMLYADGGRTHIQQSADEPIPNGFSTEVHPSFYDVSNSQDRSTVPPVEKSGRDDLAETVARRVVELLLNERDRDAGKQEGAAPRTRARAPNTLANAAGSRSLPFTPPAE